MVGTRASTYGRALRRATCRAGFGRRRRGRVGLRLVLLGRRAVPVSAVLALGYPAAKVQADERSGWCVSAGGRRRSRTTRVEARAAFELFSPVYRPYQMLYSPRCSACCSFTAAQSGRAGRWALGRRLLERGGVAGDVGEPTLLPDLGVRGFSLVLVSAWGSIGPREPGERLVWLQLPHMTTLVHSALQQGLPFVVDNHRFVRDPYMKPLRLMICHIGGSCRVCGDTLYRKEMSSAEDLYAVLGVPRCYAGADPPTASRTGR